MSKISSFLAQFSTYPGGTNSVFLASKIRIVRNIENLPFPKKLSKDTGEGMLKGVLKKIKTIPEFKDFEIFPMRELSLCERYLLEERRLISKKLVGQELGAVILSPDLKISIMVNEEDHFCLQAFGENNNFSEIYPPLLKLCEALEREFPIAYSEKMGYLTARPSNLGTGMQISTMLQLTGLVLSGQIEKVVQGLDVCGLGFLGAFGKESTPNGGKFQIIYKDIALPNEKKCSDKFEYLEDWTETIIKQEQNALERFWESSKIKLLERIARIYGEARYAVRIGDHEAIEMLAFLRVACELGIFPDYIRARIDELSVESRRAHLVSKYKSIFSEEDDETDALLRGQFFREQFASIPPPKIEI